MVRAEPGKEAPEWIRPAGKGRFFEFDNTPMGVALQEVAEWYLVDLANPEGIEGISVTGRLSRDESLDNTLRQFEQVESGRIVLVHKADSIIIKNGAAAPHKK